MSMTYAGVGLTQPKDPDTKAYLETWWDLHGRHAQLTATPFAFNANRMPATPPAARPRPNVLSWPTGASRWGEVSVYVTHEQLTAVRAAVGLTLLDYHDFVISDGTNSVTASLMFLAARPVLQKNDGPGDLYLMTLVDYRYYWQQLGPFPSSVGENTWALLIGNRFGAVGIGGGDLTISTIAAGYLAPATSYDLWTHTLWPNPHVIDAIVSMLGCRVVRLLAQPSGSYGTAQVLNAADAKAIYDANWAGCSGRVLAGGRFDGTDIARGLPYSTAVSFPGDSWHYTNVTLASLSIAEAGGCEGVIGPEAMIAAGILSNTDYAGSDYTTYATQAATDWYKWQLYANVDATFSGIVSWTPSGLEDRVEWEDDGESVATRVYRPPYNDQQLWHATEAPQRVLVTGPQDLTFTLGVAGSGNVSLFWLIQTAADAGAAAVYYRDSTFASSQAWQRWAAPTTISSGSTLTLVSGRGYTIFIRPINPTGSGNWYGSTLGGTTSNVVSFTAP